MLLKGRCLSADPFAIPASSVLAYESRLRALATGLAWFRPKYTGLFRDAAFNCRRRGTQNVPAIPDPPTPTQGVIVRAACVPS